MKLIKSKGENLLYRSGKKKQQQKPPNPKELKKMGKMRSDIFKMGKIKMRPCKKTNKQKYVNKISK